MTCSKVDDVVVDDDIDETKLPETEEVGEVRCVDVNVNVKFPEIVVLVLIVVVVLLIPGLLNEEEDDVDVYSMPCKYTRDVSIISFTMV